MYNRLITSVARWLRHPFFSNYRTLCGLWTLLAIIASVLKMKRNNNFLIFKHVFWHTIEQTPLYAEYPHQYWDTNFYGPFFSLLIAPFAVWPTWLGMTLWQIALSVGLFCAIRTLPTTQRQHIFIYWYCTIALLSALFMMQFNIAIAAFVVAAFACIEKRKEGWAALFIMAGFFVKLYGIVGLAFFFFAKRKRRLMLALIGWAVVMFALPMLISSPQYIIGQYADWWDSLVAKNDKNLFSFAQNISLLGMVRKISQSNAYPDSWLIASGLLLFALPYLRIRQYGHLAFRYAFLASTLLFVVLFSTGSETSTYIIAFVGVAIWYTTATWKRSKWDTGLLVFCFLLSGMSSSDLIPLYLRQQWIQPYALKALPCTLIWLKLCYEMCFRHYGTTPADRPLKTYRLMR